MLGASTLKSLQLSETIARARALLMAVEDGSAAGSGTAISWCRAGTARSGRARVLNILLEGYSGKEI